MTLIRLVMLLLALAPFSFVNSLFKTTAPTPANKVWGACEVLGTNCAPVLAQTVHFPTLGRQANPLWFWWGSTYDSRNCRNWTSVDSADKGTMVVWVGPVSVATVATTQAYADCDLSFPVLCACNETLVSASGSSSLFSSSSLSFLGAGVAARLVFAVAGV